MTMSFVTAHLVGIIAGYLVFSAIVGSMPPLPPTAGYWARWGYGLLNLLALNVRSGLTMLKVPIPVVVPNPEPTKIEVKIEKPEEPKS